MQTFLGWLKSQKILLESDTRYSVEVNFRTKVDEVLKSAAKITLGYASAALKKHDMHVKQVFEQEPYRIMVSARKWDNGTHACLVSWNPHENCFVISRGFYNKDRNTISVQDSKKCEAESAAEITAEVRNMMHSLKNVPDKYIQKLKKVSILKRGPK